MPTRGTTRRYEYGLLRTAGQRWRPLFYVNRPRATTFVLLFQSLFRPLSVKRTGCLMPFSWDHNAEHDGTSAEYRRNEGGTSTALGPLQRERKMNYSFAPKYQMVLLGYVTVGERLRTVCRNSIAACHILLLFTKLMVHASLL